MILIETIIGNVKNDPSWQEKTRGYQHDVLSLEQWEAQKAVAVSKASRVLISVSLWIVACG